MKSHRMSSRNWKLLARRSAMAVAVASALSGCETMGGLTMRNQQVDSPLVTTSKVLGGVAANELRSKADNAERKILAEAVAALNSNNLLRASELFNTALKLNISNSELHLLNA